MAPRSMVEAIVRELRPWVKFLGVTEFLDVVTWTGSGVGEDADQEEAATAAVAHDDQRPYPNHVVRPWTATRERRRSTCGRRAA